MPTKKIYLEYLPEFEAYGITDEKIKELTSQNITPILEFAPTDIQKLSPKQQNKKNQPTIGFLLGQDKNNYTISLAYAQTMAATGANIRFLTYNENTKQMEGLDALVLPGGTFAFPEEFYTDPQENLQKHLSARFLAYTTSIIKAEKEGLPILGICAGAQILGAMHHMKMFRDVQKYTQTSILHQTKNLNAHNVNIYPNTPLAKIFDHENIMVNSRHNESMSPHNTSPDMKIYAMSPDLVPEAWGIEEKNILCIQWHPEDLARQGNQQMQNIYNWLAEKAKEYKKAKSKKI